MSGILDASGPVKYAAISGAASGDNTLVAAVSGKRIRVLSYQLVAANTVAIRFESGAGGTALSGVMTAAVSVPITGQFNPVGHFETAAGALLNMELGGAVQVSGHITYQEVA